jgi:hypothetical protein
MDRAGCKRKMPTFGVGDQGYIGCGNENGPLFEGGPLAVRSYVTVTKLYGYR